MRALAAILALAAAAPAASQGFSDLGAIGEAPLAPAGSQAAALHPDPGASPWRYALATGIAGRFGGMRLSGRDESVLLYFGAQADGLWAEGYGQAVRLRIRLFTGGEDGIYVPSGGDAEAAYMIGRREFRFVIGRAELARHPALGIQTLAQVATLPCFEGTLPLAGDTMRLHYYLSPIEGAWVYYRGRAHIRHSAAWATESDRPSAASAGRVRYTVLLPRSVLLSFQGDLMKMWRDADLLAAAEASIGVQALQQTALFNAALRWDHYRRRGLVRDSTESESELLLLATATLAF